MKKVLSLLVVLTILVGTSAVSAITVDGNPSDWNANNVWSDGDSTGILSWGFQYESQTASDPGYLYYMIELATDFEDLASADHEGFPGLWMDVDHYSGPISLEWGKWRVKANGRTDYVSVYQAPSAAAVQPGWVPSEWLSGDAHRGIDIISELGMNTNQWGEGWNFWGYEDCSGAQASAITQESPSYAFSGHYAEFRVAIDEVVGELDSWISGDYAAGTFRNGEISGLWKVAVRSENYPLGHSGGGNYLDVVAPIEFAIFADGNNDGVCNLADYAILEVNFGRTGMTWELGNYQDNNDNDKVDLADYGMLQRTFGADISDLGPSSAVPTPEPMTLALLGLGGLLLKRKS